MIGRTVEYILKEFTLNDSRSPLRSDNLGIITPQERTNPNHLSLTGSLKGPNPCVFMVRVKLYTRVRS